MVGQISNASTNALSSGRLMGVGENVMYPSSR